MQTTDQSKRFFPGNKALPRLRALLRLAFGLLFICTGCGQAMAADTLELAWDPVADSRVAIYEVHYGSASGHYTGHVEAALPSASVPAPAAGETLYYAARACDAARTLCSGFSNEVSRAAPGVLSAGFSVSQTSGYAPLTVLFTDESSGDITSRHWELGDGAVVPDGALVTHTYSEPGIYSVRLTVEGPGGSDVYERIDYVQVLEPLPGTDGTGSGSGGSYTGTGTDQESGVDSGAEDPLADAGSFLEVGEVAVDHEWQWVGFERSFDDPVVIVTAPSANGRQATTVRVDGVGPDGFYVRLQEWDFLDGRHAVERLAYLVLERGRHQLSNGAWVEAGTLDTDATRRFDPVAFGSPFDTVPVVLASVITHNGVDAVTTRLRAIDEFGFEAKLQEQEAKPAVHAIETLAYVAWEPSAGIVDGYRFEVGLTPEMIDHRRYGLMFDSTFAAEPMFLAHLQTTWGKDTANLRWSASEEAGLEVWISEERSADGEVRHIPEAVGYLAVVDTLASPR